MERERPEYLPPIEKPRWTFPWLVVIGGAVLALAIFGIRQHPATQDAWNRRFNQPRAVTANESVTAEAHRNAAVEAKLAEQWLRKTVDMREAAKQEERKNWRCIDHVPFRQIPGGWENVPGESC